MDNSRETNDSEIATRISRVIFEHAARISRESEIFKLLELNADLARDLTGADRCSVWLLDETSGEIWTKVAHGMGQIRIPKGTGIVGACIAEDRSITVNNAGSDKRFLRSVDQASGFQTDSVLAVPLRADGLVIGAMQVLNKPGGFSNDDVEILRFMALYSASEIQSEKLRQEAETGRLLRRELDLAQEVQRNLLPQELGVVAGLEYEGFFRPARSVGGDYYDFLDLPNGLFSLVLGDVSGKGLPAAVLMASIQMLLRSQLLRQALPISKLVEEVSHTLYRCSSSDRYSTLFCAVLDKERRRLTYVNAGHPPALIIRQSGGIEWLMATGIPIGVLPTSCYREETVAVAPGDLVLCSSDGVTESMNTSGEMLDEVGVERIVRLHSGASPRALLAAMVKSLDEHSAGTDQYDDITIAALRISK